MNTEILNAVQRREKALFACRELVRAYVSKEASEDGIDWDQASYAYSLACGALGDDAVAEIKAEEGYEEE